MDIQLYNLSPQTSIYTHHSLRCPLTIVNRTPYTVHRTPYSVHRTVHSVQCTVYNGVQMLNDPYTSEPQTKHSDSDYGTPGRVTYVSYTSPIHEPSKRPLCIGCVLTIQFRYREFRYDPQPVLMGPRWRWSCRWM